MRNSSKRVLYIIPTALFFALSVSALVGHLRETALAQQLNTAEPEPLHHPRFKSDRLPSLPVEQPLGTVIGPKEHNERYYFKYQGGPKPCVLMDRELNTVEGALPLTDKGDCNHTVNEGHSLK